MRAPAHGLGLRGRHSISSTLPGRMSPSLTGAAACERATGIRVHQYCKRAVGPMNGCVLDQRTCGRPEGKDMPKAIQNVGHVDPQQCIGTVGSYGASCVLSNSALPCGCQGRDLRVWTLIPSATRDQTWRV